ncbi:MAG: peptide ABC transporter substrate-binding protein [Xanthomonadales bacterium]|nr:peptide ABC transporter substrate-binding protein [Xanthomonadales bacterium]
MTAACAKRICLLMFLSLLVTACGKSTDDKQSPLFSGGDEKVTDSLVLRRGNGEEPQTLDPHRATGVPSANILRDLFEGLTTETAGGNIIPGAAHRWNISADGLTYTFYLDPLGHWSNGDPVTAQDFVFGLRRSVTPETASVYAGMLAPIKNATEILAGEKMPSALGVSALEEFTLQIHLTSPTAYFLGMLNHSATYPLHQVSLRAAKGSFSHPGQLVSNGAYQLTDWAVRSFIELKKNPYYRGADSVRIETVRFYVLPDQSTEIKLFRSGALDWTNDVPIGQYQWLLENMADELVLNPWMGSYFLGFNLSREPFRGNKALRLALALAVDRDLLTEKVTRFGEQPAYALVPPGSPDYTPQEPEWASWTQAERDIAALEYYAQAGYSEDKPLVVEFRYNTSENHKKVALAVSSMWRQKLGVQSHLINEEWKVFLQNRRHKVLTQVFRAGWISDYNDPVSFLDLLTNISGNNDFAYNNEDFNSLLLQASQERIPLRRRRLLQAAEAIMIADQPLVPLYTYVTKRLVSQRLGGWQHNVMDHHYSRYMYFNDKGSESKSESESGNSSAELTTEPAAEIVEKPPAEASSEGG